MGRQPAPLLVIEPGSFAQLLLEDLHLLLEIFDDVLLVTVQTACKADEEQLENVHRAMLSKLMPPKHEIHASQAQDDRRLPRRSE